MTKITTGASVSLDGYISGPEESGFDQLFQWYGNGEIASDMGGMPLKLTEASDAHIRALLATTGALVVGRHLFDHVDGWDGKHPMGVPVVVLTHSVPEGWEREGEWFTFVTEGGIEAAIETAKRLAGGKDVGLNGGTIATQALAAGLLDEVSLDLVPVILGAGRPFFGSLADGPYVLEGPISAVQGNRVTHLRYRVVARD
jgi:dihydrofolate reductase